MFTEPALGEPLYSMSGGVEFDSVSIVDPVRPSFVLTHIIKGSTQSTHITFDSICFPVQQHPSQA